MCAKKQEQGHQAKKIPILSVIVPVFNTENFLCRCIDSILQQTWTDFELVLIDDASSDGSIDRMKEYAQKDQRVRIIRHPENKGLFQARITGVKESKGEYIAFVDSDDAITKDFYRVLLEKCKTENADMVMGNTIFVDESGWKYVYNAAAGLTRTRTLEGNQIFDHFIKNEGACFSWHTTVNKVYRKSLWERALNDYSAIQGHLIMTEDILFSTALYFYAQKMCFLPHDGYFYYRHSQASTGKTSSLDSLWKKLNDQSVTCAFMKKFLKDKNLYSQYKKNYQNWYNRYFRWNSGLVKMFTDNQEVSAQRKEEIVKQFLALFHKTEMQFPNQEDAYFETLKTTWNEQYQSLIADICNPDFTYISFDIFDTLILRPFWEPQDLFLYMQHTFQAKNINLEIPFCSMRLEAEQETRRLNAVLNPTQEDVTLEEIYNTLQNKFGLDNGTCHLMKDYEESLEINFATARKSIKQLYDLATFLGKKVIMVSDMYLEKATIIAILKKCGYKSFHSIYLSSELKRLKATASIFHFVKNDLGTDGAAILHIGDNWKADIEVARACGINARFVGKTSHLFMNWIKDVPVSNLKEIYTQNTGGLVDYTYSMQQLSMRCMLALVANKFFDYPFQAFYDDSTYNANAYYIGYHAVGFLMLGLVVWMLEDSTKEKYETLHFLARDGFLPKKIYDLLSPAYPKAPRSNYLHISRQSLIPFLFKQPIDFYQLESIISITKYSGNGILNLCAPALKPISEEIKEQYIQQGIDLDKKFTDKNEFYYFIKHLIAYSYDQDILAGMRQEACGYFGGIFGDKDATYDMGYSGRLQNILVGCAGKSIDSYFLYANGYNTLVNCLHYNYQIKTFYDYTPKGSCSARELILSDTNPSCKGYDFANHTPLFDEDDTSYQERYVIQEIADGATDFCGDIKEAFAQSIYMFRLRSGDCMAPFENFLCNIRPFDMSLFSCCHIEDTVYGNIQKFPLISLWYEDIKLRKVPQSETKITPDKKDFVPDKHSLLLSDMYADGLFVHFYKAINALFPKNTKRREVVKNLVYKMLKKRPEGV